MIGYAVVLAIGMALLALAVWRIARLRTAQSGASTMSKRAWSRSRRRPGRRASAPARPHERRHQRLPDAEDAVAAERLAGHEDVRDSVRKPGALTRKCRCGARIGDRPVAASRAPTGPSAGIGYGVGVSAQNR